MNILFDVKIRRTWGPPKGFDVVGKILEDHVPKLIMVSDNEPSSYMIESVEYREVSQPNSSMVIQEIAEAVADWHHNGSMVPALITYIEAMQRAGFKIVRD